MRFSRAVSPRSKLLCCATTPISAWAATGSSVMERPSRKHLAARDVKADAAHGLVPAAALARVRLAKVAHLQDVVCHRCSLVLYPEGVSIGW